MGKLFGCLILGVGYTLDAAGKVAGCVLDFLASFLPEPGNKDDSKKE